MSAGFQVGQSGRGLSSAAWAAKRRFGFATLGFILALIAGFPRPAAAEPIAQSRFQAARTASIECLLDTTACNSSREVLSTSGLIPRLPRYRGRYDGYVYEIDYLHYPVSTGYGFTLPFGHAGVLAIDPSGITKYFEYGRYVTNFGQVEKRRIPNVTIGPDRRPTAESMRDLFAYLSSHFGKNSAVRAVYCPGASYWRVKWFGINRMRDTHRRAYSWNPLNPNDCKTFVADAIAAGTGSHGWTAGGGHRTSMDLEASACASTKRSDYQDPRLTTICRNASRKLGVRYRSAIQFPSRSPPPVYA
ncbi:MAG TPA: hypothetical protein VMH37_02130 [Candidatus Binataceae bacterium]|nr:hypothetical protein [Candidatus Binataceae bacterium]